MIITVISETLNVHYIISCFLMHIIVKKKMKLINIKKNTTAAKTIFCTKIIKDSFFILKRAYYKAIH